MNGQKIQPHSNDKDKPYIFRKKVLDHGFVELLDVLGSDEAIIKAARTSYDKGTKKVSSTPGLLRYLMRHKHLGPFEFGECVFRIRCPLFVARQWFRHRTASYNEVSLRYSEAINEYYLPPVEWITTQDRKNKQARTNSIVPKAMEVRSQLETDANMLLEHYELYLEDGVAREIARINLPLSLYTTFMFKMDIRNLLNFLTLRFDSHAQLEIRKYAEVMAEMIEYYFPLTIQAWRDFMKEAITFSKPELSILSAILKKEINLLDLIDIYLDKYIDDNIISKSESLEFKTKIEKMLNDY